jgi:hypothetical protein
MRNASNERETEMNDLTEFFGEPIAVYTTTEALADGVLVDAGEMAKELFEWPVLLTAAAWNDCVTWTDEDSERTGSYGQSETGRLWDVLWMATPVVRRQRVPAQDFQLYRVSRDARPGEDGEVEAELVTLKVTGSFHDDGTPLLVISLPEED